jgi:hypothetical protein
LTPVLPRTVHAPHDINTLHEAALFLLPRLEDPKWAKVLALLWQAVDGATTIEAATTALERALCGSTELDLEPWRQRPVGNLRREPPSAPRPGRAAALHELAKLADDTKRERRKQDALSGLSPLMSRVLRRRDKDDMVLVTETRFQNAIRELIDRGLLVPAGSNNVYALTRAGIDVCNILGYKPDKRSGPDP